MTQITTNIVGFSDTEWAQIKAAAQALQVTGADAGTLIFPTRPEVYRLKRRGGHFELRLSTEEEAMANLVQQAR